MTEAEARLEALWKDGLPPARDAMFRLSVLQRIERRRMMHKVAAVAALGLALAVLAWSLAPRMVVTAQAGVWIATLSTIVLLGWTVMTLRRPSLHPN